jgi:hypothetical protein
MEKIIEELLYIEEQAIAVLDKPARLKAALPIRISEETTRRNVVIQKETDKAIRTIAQNAAMETEKKIKEFETKNSQAVSQLNTMFTKHQITWRDKIVSCILKG